VHAKAIALVGLHLSLQESWNVPNAELIMYFFLHIRVSKWVPFHFCLVPVGYSLASPEKSFAECKRINVMTGDLMDESNPTR